MPRNEPSQREVNLRPREKERRRQQQIFIQKNCGCECQTRRQTTSFQLAEEHWSALFLEWAARAPLVGSGRQAFTLLVTLVQSAHK